MVAVDRDARLHVPAEAESGNRGDQQRPPFLGALRMPGARSLGKARTRERGRKENLALPRQRASFPLEGASSMKKSVFYAKKVRMRQSTRDNSAYLAAGAVHGQNVTFGP